MYFSEFPAMNRVAFNKQAGMSLIELMVALTISLIIILAATTVYVAGKDGFRTTDDRNRNLESGRLALDMLTRNLRMAGACNYDVTTNRRVIECNVAPAPPALVGVEGGAVADTLTVSYQNDQAFNPVMLQGSDCQGQAVAVGGFVTNTFGVSADGQLTCRAGAAAARSVVGSVADFQVIYGVLLGADPKPAADPIVPVIQWVDASGVTDWSAVRSVELCLDIVSFEQGMTDGSTPGLNCRQAAFPADGRVHRIYRTTINVRNATRGGNLIDPSTGAPLP
jgi:type IV pilus assembly protein PilW